MTKLSLNTWSLQKVLGPLRTVEWDEEAQAHKLAEEDAPEEMSLLELPKALREKGFAAAEVSYAQFRDTSERYLTEVEKAFTDAGVEFASLLLDYGDLSSGDLYRRNADIAWTREWLGRASLAGAKRVRVSPGEAPPDDELALERSGEALRELSKAAEELGVRLVIENIGRLGSTAVNCLSLLGRCEGRLGFTADFGNFPEDKYRELHYVLPRAETVHAKARIREGDRIDEEDFRRCLELAADSGFDGICSLVYEGQGDPWSGIERIRRLTSPLLEKSGQSHSRG
ncbi:sugar phosphate isomerase/epimerase family protein [Gorillibacterium sp. sgz500922]|uniref:sugar phosphate isomerase/epimerase family protein n=1 Tax=Gorillibacterium sp. sgz500922 TaxID=3446694 RepID=UPI003F681EBD